MYYTHTAPEIESRAVEFHEPPTRERALPVHAACQRPIGELATAESYVCLLSFCSSSGFSASVSQPYNITSPSSSRVIVFDKVSRNEGGFYDAKLGSFSPNCKGVFFFTLDLSSQRGTLASVHLMHNELVALNLRANGRFTGDSGTASTSTILQLNAGDQVFVVLVYD
jgi:hypothetical protein